MPKIVLIEDEIQLAENTKIILEINGFNCFVANRGQEGIDLIASINPNLVICDINLDEIDGYEILRQIRSNPLFLNLPFVFLTARADFVDKRRGMNAGADDFLTKPFNAKVLIETIQARLAMSSQKKESVGIEIKKNAIDVFYHVSNHEYLTPLNGIINLSEIALDMVRNKQTSDIESLLEGIYSSGNRMLRTTRKLLWYNQLSNSVNPWKNVLGANSQINAIKFLHEIVDSVTKSSLKIFDINIKSNVTYLYGYDENLIQIMFTELIQNIVNFADHNRKVYINARFENDFLVLIIRNHYLDNYTITTEDIKPFYQAHNPKDMNGTGLGLYIVKEWIELISGGFEVKGENQLFDVIIKIPVSL
ncbi:response regulator [Arcicella sp. DC2W]|uniref:histidine kinase n=1 Tax=Arcicella gelida TaxID=2984195 RepID=A0ABU5S477_9BACT|nr:response regulator [Arcicella sp. DC2W]MEA5403300.1 response regulator [Arcicella sp. DC2W]